MTVIGKILAFLVFFLSLIFLGFAISINRINKDPISKKSWYEVAQENKKEVESARRDFEAMDKKLLGERAEFNKQLDVLKADAGNLAREVAAAKDAAAKADAETLIAKKNFENSQLAANAAVDELNQRRVELTKLYAQQKDKDLVISSQQASITRVTNEKIQAQTAAESYYKRLNEQIKDNQGLVRALEEAREQMARGGALVPGGEKLVLNPPPQDVQGLVTSVNGDLVQISIGSDDGILKGHTLEVFRLEPKPQYLGPIRIVDVQAKQAVGKLLSTQTKKLVQPNDQVASSILPTTR